MAQLLETPPAPERTLERFGMRPVINARGVYTTLGGRLSPAVWELASAANADYCPVEELLDGSGAFIARLVGAPAARVTPGALAAMAMGLAACIAGTDGPRLERLPHAEGMRAEVIVQRGQRYRYRRGALLAGARLVEVGDEAGTTLEQLEQAIGERTGALLVPAHLDGAGGSVPLAQAIEVAHRHGVPVYVDAAYMSFPTELIGSYTALGADLVGFSAKYFRGPSAGGFLTGSREMIDAVAALDFVRFELGEHRVFGRGYKLDRWTIVATAAALEEWFATDHEARLSRLRSRAGELARALDALPDAVAEPRHFTREDTLEDEPVNAVVLRLAGGPAACAALAQRLRDGEPRIVCTRQEERLIFCLETVDERDDAALTARVREAAGGER